MTQFKLPLTFVQRQPPFVLDATEVQGLALALSLSFSHLLSVTVSLSFPLPLSPHALSCFVRFIVIVIICVCVCVCCLQLSNGTIWPPHRTPLALLWLAGEWLGRELNDGTRCLPSSPFVTRLMTRPDPIHDPWFPNGSLLKCLFTELSHWAQNWHPHEPEMDTAHTQFTSAPLHHGTAEGVNYHKAGSKWCKECPFPVVVAWQASKNQ